jgi:malonate decarboxylase epsilon subunit
MLGELPSHPQIHATFDEGSRLLGFDVMELDTSDSLSSTVSVQTAIFLCGVAAARALAAEGAKPDLVAGHSVGAFAAAVSAGAIGFQDALALVRLRAQSMEALFPHGYGMAAVMGVKEQRLQQLLDRVNALDKVASSPDRAQQPSVFIANVNAPHQIVVAGSLPGIDQTIAFVEEECAAKSRKLKVSVPSHCPWLQPVAERLTDALKHIKMLPPAIPCFSSRQARLMRDAEAIREDLALGVTQPVRWHETAVLAFEHGARLFVEMPPGAALSDLASASFPCARSLPFSQSRIESLVYLCRK